MKAPDILTTAARVMADRGKHRDNGEERSMAKAVAAFNVLTGHRLDEVDGWRFMEILKIARGREPDNFVDGAAFAALAGEANNGE